ncbi:MAG: hypothetical protein RL266_603 [Bacteroidota bacterium]
MPMGNILLTSWLPISADLEIGLDAVLGIEVGDMGGSGLGCINHCQKIKVGFVYIGMGG